jgi:hypothetical protein
LTIEVAKLKNDLRPSNIEALAVLTDGYSGRDIINIVKSAWQAELDADVTRKPEVTTKLPVLRMVLKI